MLKMTEAFSNLDNRLQNSFNEMFAGEGDGFHLLKMDWFYLYSRMRGLSYKKWCKT